RLNQAGAKVTTIGCSDRADVRLPEPTEPALGALLQITAFYAFIERLAIGLGENPDAPPGLKKVTETV
ncbi:MAG: aminotransferase, partial [Rhodobacteraceae bacterium]|nr:aminotransferase [Paracoccaceae bacterium]